MCLLCKEGERIDDLQRGGLKILQKEHGFRFGTDAVLLSDFALIRRRERVADFGTGTGVIALLIAARHPDVRLDAIELQPDMADMARRSVEMNGLQDRITMHEGDLRDAPKMLGCGRLDAVICNPPYNDPGRSLPPED
ncbi:MAG: methyltransferase, partial [Clostridia bacterium]|nr:methyltransferase [Clostridia bacterium]